MNINNTQREVLDKLKGEVDEMLHFMVEMDLKIYGKVSESVKECFITQGVAFPEQLNGSVH